MDLFPFSDGFHNAWRYFHERQMDILRTILEKDDHGYDSMDYIIWTSGLTAEPYLHQLMPLNCTIQIWADSSVSNDLIQN